MSIVLPVYGFATLDKYSICFTEVHWWLLVAVAVSATLLYLNYIYIVSVFMYRLLLMCFVCVICEFIIQYILLKTKQKKAHMSIHWWNYDVVTSAC